MAQDCNSCEEAEGGICVRNTRLMKGKKATFWPISMDRSMKPLFRSSSPHKDFFFFSFFEGFVLSSFNFSFDQSFGSDMRTMQT